MNEKMIEAVIISQAKGLAKEKLGLRVYSTGRTPSDKLETRKDETQHILLFTVKSMDLHLDTVQITGFVTGDGVICFTGIKFKGVHYFYPNFTPIKEEERW